MRRSDSADAELADGCGLSVSRVLRQLHAGVGPEWPLVKAAIIAGAAFPVAAAVGDLYEAAARLIEQWIRFRSALDRPRFLAVGARADEVPREVK